MFRPCVTPTYHVWRLARARGRLAWVHLASWRGADETAHTGLHLLLPCALIAAVGFGSTVGGFDASSCAVRAAQCGTTPAASALRACSSLLEAYALAQGPAEPHSMLLSDVAFLPHRSGYCVSLALLLFRPRHRGLRR
jgi:hypothetical protein